MTYHNENIEALVAASDEALVRLARQGHTRAFEMLVKRYEQPLYNYLRRLSGNGSDAEDLFQETFLRVYGNLDRFKDTGRFRPWVYQIATNLCRDRIRYRKRRPQVSLDQPLNEEAGPATVMDRLASANAGPGEQA
ncbi:MAG: hypothetical protein QG656_2634, partial [Candidatus Hydrogenedentes bacterium]|nr:hypothetical protein [Candidatus Hydrogenedentota bacterium]